MKKLFADLYIARGYDVSEVRADTVCVWVGRNGVHVMSVCVGWVAVGGGGCLFVCNGWFE